ncbi:MAG: hypothetical protein MJ247_02670 [Alphaproteobacteria bacterium]|nr:hypothetical protein [Alphaproteobacteria bacterium]
MTTLNTKLSGFDLSLLNDNMSERLMIQAKAQLAPEYQPQLEEIALKRIQMIANGYGCTPDFAPIMRSLVGTFVSCPNPKMTKACQEAVAKLKDSLKEFDYENMIDEFPSMDLVQKNIELLEDFDERIKPLDRNEDGSVKYKSFEHAIKVISAIDVTDDSDENVLEYDTNEFADTFVEACKLKTFTALVPFKTELDEDTYINHLRFEMERGLVMLLVADKAEKLMPLTEENMKNITIEFEKLLESIPS